MLSASRHKLARIFRGAAGLSIIGGFAFAVRLGTIAASPAPVLIGDARGYHEYAVALLHEGSFHDGDGNRASRTPGYPLFLAAVYALFGERVRAVQIIQCALGALMVVLVMACARRWLAEPWAVMCGIAAALYYGAIAPCSSVLSECLYAVCLAAGWWMLHATTWNRTISAAGFGAALGAAALTRPEAILLGGVALLAATPLLRPRAVAAGFGVMLALIAPWAFRNYRVLGKPLMGSTHGGASLYAGLELPLERMGLSGPYYNPGPVNELERDRQYREQFRSLVARTSIGRAVLAYAFNFGTHFYPFLPQYDMTFMLLLPFWLAGASFAWRRPELRAAAAAAAASIVLYTFLGGPASRYRQAYAPLQLLLAAPAIEAAWVCGRLSVRRLAGAWVVLNVAVWLFSDTVRQAALLVRQAVFH